MNNNKLGELAQRRNRPATGNTRNPGTPSTPNTDGAKGPQMKKVGNFLIDLDRQLGKGQYGSVYLSHGLPPNEAQKLGSLANGTQNGSYGGSITQTKNVKTQFYACKVVERKELDCKQKEELIKNEINNQDAIQSDYVTSLNKAIKTDSRYYIFMELCNGNDLKEVMEQKNWKVSPVVVQKIMY